MAGTIICARHGRTTKIIDTVIGPRCGEERSRRDLELRRPDNEQLRAKLALAESVCGRDPLDECPGCKHPAHGGHGCSTMLVYDGGGAMKWCNCAGR